MNQRDRDLRDLLKKHDPARATSGLSPIERARMRNAVVAAEPSGSAVGPHRKLIAALAAVLVIASALALRLGPLRHPVPPDPQTTAAVARPRQIQFVTAGGTRVIWILKPNTEL